MIDLLLARVREAVALRLWELGAIRVRPDEPFTLASGDRSPVYFDCRLAVSDPLVLDLFAAATRRFLQSGVLRGSALAGGETAGIPFAAHLGSALSMPMLYVRKAAKAHGRGRRIEGILEAGTDVVLVEDLITDGGSKLGFLDALEEAGGSVGGVLVLFDREQGGRELLAERGVVLAAASDRSTALRVGRDSGALTEGAASEVETYFADPASWSASHPG